MSDSNENNKKSAPSPIEQLSEAEQKELIEKLKAQLTLEDSENIKLYAALLKACAL